MWFISCLLFFLVHVDSSVYDSKNRVARDFRALIENGINYHKNLVHQYEAGNAVRQLTAVQQADSKSEF